MGLIPEVHQPGLVVFLDDEQDRRRVLEAGADDMLIRGIRADVILETIERLLAEGALNAGAARGRS